MLKIGRNTDSLPGTTSHEHDESVNNRIEHMIDKCVHINCQRVQLFRLGQLPMRHFQRASLAHIPRLSHRKRLVIVPGMHEETPRSSRGHIQARLGGKVNNRVALSTSIRIHQDLDPAHRCPSKSPTRVFRPSIIARRDLPQFSEQSTLPNLIP